jgi:aminoglycoside phosphotransferase (APT) family kinase protein
MSQDELIERCRRLLLELKLVAPSAVVSTMPLAGGVSSDVLRVDADGSTYCVKFALEALRVATHWEAPLRRNRTEYAWLDFAAGVATASVPRLFGHSEHENGFAMELIGGEVRNWKDDLLAGWVDDAVAHAVGDLIGQLHSASARGVPDSDRFNNAEDFHALRTEPYFVHLVPTYPDLAARIEALAEHYRTCRTVLIHGDVSPKNILLRRTTPILLDAECATMGDPAFDLGFCLNHLLLKSVHLPASRPALLGAARALWSGYRSKVDWEAVAEIEGRVTALAPLLMLARVDGKSPVEYLSPTARQAVRGVARDLLDRPAAAIVQLINRMEVCAA